MMLPFVDLAAQQQRLRQNIEAALQRVLDHGRFLGGPEIEALEQALATRCGASSVIACGSGTDALVMSLMAQGIGQDDVVFVPSFTFVATAEAVKLVGATPFFVDVCPHTFNIDPARLEEDLTQVPPALNPRAVIAVDLFGSPADYAALTTICKAHSLFLIADAAQSLGASRDGVPVGRLAPLTTTSFYPAKPLGGYGDSGAICVHAADQPEPWNLLLRSLREHGRAEEERYRHPRLGLNARMDTFQAAILLEKLRIFPEELQARQRVANLYQEGLGDLAAPRQAGSSRAGSSRPKLILPQLPAGVQSTWAQYTLRTPRRKALAAHLKARGIPTQIYYPLPLHRQPAYADGLIPPEGLPVSERLATEVLSLPIHPYLDGGTQHGIIAAIRAFFEEKG